MTARKPRKTADHGLFAELVAPRLVNWLDPGGGPRPWKLFSVESNGAARIQPVCGVPEHFDAADVCRILDAAGHIDYLLQTSDGVLRGLSSRIQKGEWATFTIRAWSRSGNGVEGDHIRRAVNNPHEGLISPGYHVQAYVSDDESRVNRVAMARWSDLIRYVDAPPVGASPPRGQPVIGGNGMVAVAWDDLARFNVKVWRWPE